MKTARILASIAALFSASERATAQQDTLAIQKPTPQMVEEAKKNPNGWVYAIEGNFGPNDAVPPEAIVGAWKVSPDGKIVEGSFRENPNFKGTQK
jgi:hypothetical protein